MTKSIRRREHNVSADQVYRRNEKIAGGSAALWAVIKEELDRAIRDGLLS